MQVESEKSCENEVVIRLQYIKDNILQTSDPDLNKHLNELDISLQLFGMYAFTCFSLLMFRHYIMYINFDVIEDGCGCSLDGNSHCRNYWFYGMQFLPWTILSL